MRNLRIWWKAEHGAAMISLFILALPLIIGVFGFGFDEARANYIKGYLQNRATLAVQSALASSTNTNSNGSLYIDPSVTSAVYQQYEDNTTNYRGEAKTILNCTNGEIEDTSIVAGQCGSTVTSVGAPGTLLSYCQPHFGAVNPGYGLDFRVKEQVNTVFLRIIGIKTLTLSTINAVALLRPNCP